MTATKTWREAVAALEAARERAGEMLGRPLIADLVDRATGELEPVRVVTDNGPRLQSRGIRQVHRLAAGVRARAHPPPLAGDQRRHRAVLRLDQIEHLYLHEIDDGPALAEHVAGYQQLYNHERPHETIDWALPAARYTADPA